MKQNYIDSLKDYVTATFWDQYGRDLKDPVLVVFEDDAWHSCGLDVFGRARSSDEYDRSLATLMQLTVAQLAPRVAAVIALARAAGGCNYDLLLVHVETPAESYNMVFNVSDPARDLVLAAEGIELTGTFTGLFAAPPMRHYYVYLRHEDGWREFCRGGQPVDAPIDYDDIKHHCYRTARQAMPMAHLDKKDFLSRLKVTLKPLSDPGDAGASGASKS